MSAFSAPDKPVIFWTPDTGAVVVRGAINAGWEKLGGATGALGVPTGEQTAKGDTVTQKFSGGELSWNMEKGVQLGSRGSGCLTVGSGNARGCGRDAGHSSSGEAGSRAAGAGGGC